MRHHEALSSWTGQAKGCGVKEIPETARSIKELKTFVVDTWMTGCTNAYAENVNKRVKDDIRRSSRSAKCENMRRRLLLTFGFPPLEKRGVPLPNYSE